MKIQDIFISYTSKFNCKLDINTKYTHGHTADREYWSAVRVYYR